MSNNNFFIYKTSADQVSLYRSGEIGSLMLSGLDELQINSNFNIKNLQNNFVNIDFNDQLFLLGNNKFIFAFSPSGQGEAAYLYQIESGKSLNLSLGNQFYNGNSLVEDFFDLTYKTGNLNLDVGVNISGNLKVSDTGVFNALDLKNRPTVNGTGVLLSGEAANFKFIEDLNVSLSDNKTFGRYSNGETIPASGKTLSQFFNLVLVEPIRPTVSLTSSTVIPFNQTSINNVLNASNTINSLNSSVQTGVIEFRRGDVGSYAKLIGNQSSSFVYTHSLTDTASNANAFNYRYIVSGTMGESNTGTLTIAPSFFYRNYLGYSPNTTLTFSQLEALSNSVLSDSKSRTISSVTAGAGNYTYYCYRASQGDLSSVLYGTFDVLGSFTKLTDVVGVNSNGVTVTYRVYKSNSTDAFTNASLTFN